MLIKINEKLSVECMRTIFAFQDVAIDGKEIVDTYVCLTGQLLILTVAQKMMEYYWYTDMFLSLEQSPERRTQ